MSEQSYPLREQSHAKIHVDVTERVAHDGVSTERVRGQPSYIRFAVVTKQPIHERPLAKTTYSATTLCWHSNLLSDRYVK